MADYRHAVPVEAGKARDDGGVIRKPAVAVDLDPVGEEATDVVKAVGTVGVSCQLALLPGRQVLGDAPRLLLELSLSGERSRPGSRAPAPLHLCEPLTQLFEGHEEGRGCCSGHIPGL